MGMVMTAARACSPTVKYSDRINSDLHCLGPGLAEHVRQMTQSLSYVGRRVSYMNRIVGGLNGVYDKQYL